MFRRPVFWVLLFLICILSAIFAFKYFPQAFPVVTIDLKMDRTIALQYAKDLALKYDWKPYDFNQAASFTLDRQVQNFVELEAGGSKAFSKMLKEKLYYPYSWHVRHFRENEINETYIIFTPDGKPYGFVEKLPEDETGTNLTVDAARFIAESNAVGKWKVDLSAYELIEESQEVHPGGRIDHTFIYERPDVQIGEGHYRLRLVISGDRFTELTHFINIPEAFSRRYREMRSANETISYLASVTTAIIYILGGCFFGLFILYRQRWVLWRKPIIWGLIIAFVQVLAAINQWPLDWMNYDTAISTHGLLLQKLMDLVLTFVYSVFLMSLSFMAAESLSRRAFPNHIQQWKLWTPNVANSFSVLGRTVGGYLIVGFHLAFVVGIYFFTTKVLGWWTPSDTLLEPDILATHFPWLSSIAVSLQAGFWEECLFRAVPIAGAVFISRKLGHRRIWITTALIVQAVIFGAGHASYATQPSYARIIELIIPSLIYGGIYLRFGLLPAIISHFTYDVIWTALPLFVSSAPGIWVDQLLVVIFTLVPLGVVLYIKWRSGVWCEIKQEYYNYSWKPAVQKEVSPNVVKLREIETISARTKRLLLVGGLAGLAIWFFFTDFKCYEPTLAVGRKEAIAMAETTLNKHNTALPENLHILSSVITPVGSDDRFVWQQGGEKAYGDLIGKYLSPPYWRVRFAQFEGDVAQRAEEYQVFINKSGEIYRVYHKLPEAAPGEILTANEARVIAHRTLIETLKLDPSSLIETRIKSLKLPSRQDWLFEFEDSPNYPLEDGMARIAVHIAGDEVVDTYRYVYLPEEWLRQERNKKNLTGNVQTFCFMILSTLLIAGVIAAFISWSRKNICIPVFMRFFVLLLGIGIISTVNRWPARLAHFSTAEPLKNQAFTTSIFSLLQILFLAAVYPFFMGLIQSWRNEQKHADNYQNALLGILLGVLFAGVISLVNSIVPSTIPHWADYRAADTYFPILGAALDPIGEFIIKTTMILFIFAAVDHFSRFWTKWRGWFTIGLVLSGLIISGLTINSFLHWFLSGMIIGIFLLLSYRLIFRMFLPLIPLSLAVITVLKLIRESIFHAYPGAITGSILGIVLTSIFAVYWYRTLLNLEV